MKKLSNVLKISLIAASGIVLVAAPVFAQESSTTNTKIGLQVSSPIYEYTIKPGAVQQDIIKIKNVGTSTNTFYPQVVDFKSDNKSGSPVPLKVGEENGSYSLAKWISFTTESTTLNAGESAAFNFNVTVPENAEPGGHYALILFSTQAPAVAGNGVSLVSEVGSIILVRVAGNAKEAAAVKDFTTDKTNYNTAKVNFTTTINNSGNVHIQPKGVITIKNIFGGQVAAVDVNQLGGNVLPGSDREFASSWNDPGFKLGYYTATVTLSFGNPAQTITAQTSFWILPWTTIITLLAIVILLAIVLYFAIKRYNHYIISRAQKSNKPQ